jgi:hypothetical protein
MRPTNTIHSVVAWAADDRRRHQRARRVDRGDTGGDEVVGAEREGVERQQRDHDREAEHVDQHDQEDR